MARTGSRWRVRYSPSGPSASMAISSVSEGISVDTFDDRLAFEGGHGPHLAERVADLPIEPRKPDGAVAFQVVRQEHAPADVVHDHLSALPVRHLRTGG